MVKREINISGYYTAKFRPEILNRLLENGPILLSLNNPRPFRSMWGFQIQQATAVIRPNSGGEGGGMVDGSAGGKEGPKFVTVGKGDTPSDNKQTESYVLFCLSG